MKRLRDMLQAIRSKVSSSLHKIIAKRANFRLLQHRLLVLWRVALRATPLISLLLVTWVVVAAWRDLRRQPIPKAPDQPHSSGLIRYEVTLESFDVDTQIVRAVAQVTFDPVPMKPQSALITTYPSPFYCQGNTQFALGLSNPVLFVGFNGKPQFGDLGWAFSQGGLRAIQDVQPLGPCDPNQAGSNFVHYVLPAQTELYAVGDPRRFPFDQYLVIYRMWIPVLIQKQGGGYVGVLGLNEVTDKLTGFKMRYPGPREIEAWARRENINPRFKAVGYNKQMWAGRQMAVILERGVFIRTITIVLALVVFVYLVSFAFQSKKKENLVPDILGFFLTVWAIRSALSVGGPDVATFIDYGALLFYICFIGILLCKYAKQARENLDENPDLKP